MASAELLKVTHSVDGKVDNVHGDVQDIGSKVQNVDGRVQDVQDDVQDVGNKVQDIGSDVKNISSEVREVNRSQLRDSILRWLLPPVPSINHNIACKVHHKGTAQWFFQGSIFTQWKANGSFSWMHGKPGSGKSILCPSIIEDNGCTR